MATTTAWTDSDTQASVELNSGSSWATPDRAESDDELQATSALLKSDNSDYLRLSKFGFAIPSGATINKIEARVDRKCTTSGDLNDYRLYLHLLGTAKGSNKADTETYWGTSYDDPEYEWSDAEIGDLTVANINSDDFGVELAVWNHDSGATRAAYVDVMQLRITYTEAVGFQPWVIIM